MFTRATLNLKSSVSLNLSIDVVRPKIRRQIDIEGKADVVAQALLPLRDVADEARRTRRAGKGGRHPRLLGAFLDQIIHQAEAQRLSACHQMVELARRRMLALRTLAHPELQIAALSGETVEMDAIGARPEQGHRCAFHLEQRRGVEIE